VRVTSTAIRRTTSVAALIVAGAAPLRRVGTRGPVYDQKFIDYFNKKGVPYMNETDAIRTAKQFCLDMSR
jgi:hypothetical protein